MDGLMEGLEPDQSDNFCGNIVERVGSNKLETEVSLRYVLLAAYLLLPRTLSLFGAMGGGSMLLAMKPY